MTDTRIASVTTAELPALLAAGPVTIRVGDAGDPCGTRKIARVLEAACTADVWDREYDRYTVGRWMLAFATPEGLSSLLVTSVDARFEVTVDAPEDSGPCVMCAAHAAMLAAQAAAAPGEVPRWARSPLALLADEAQARGREAGWTHANYVDNMTACDWSVPDRFAEVAEDYRTAFEEGMAEYREEHEEV